MPFALSLIASAAIAGVLLLSGWGAWARLAFRVPSGPMADWLDDLWVGLGLALAFLQVWHLWRPVNGACWLLVVLVGASGWLTRWRSLAAVVALIRRRPSLMALGVGLALAATLFVARRSLGPLSHYDTYLYHYPSVEWASAYPIVPGLANLHGRLGFNNAYALFAALVDRGPLDGRSHHLVGAIVLLGGLIHAIGAAARGLADRAQPPWLSVYAALMIGPLLTQAGSLVGLSNDLPVFVLGCVLALAFARIIALPMSDPKTAGYAWFGVVVVAAAGVTIKLSFAFFAAAVVLLGAARRLRPRGEDRPLSGGWLGAIVALGGGLVLVPWVVRGYVLSGYPLYPSTLGGVAFAWRVPRALALTESYCITAFARNPEAHWAHILDGWAWLGPWWSRHGGALLTPALLAVFGGALVVIRSRLDRDRDRLRLAAWLVAPLVASLAAWLWLAPAPRFAGAPLWIVSGLLLALAIGFPRWLARKWLVWLVGGAWLLLTVSAGDVRALAGGYFQRPLERAERSTFTVRTTDNGDRVYLPADFWCAGLPLPCTPYFRPNLRARTPGDPGGGFALAPTLTYADMRQTLPSEQGLTTSPNVGACIVARGGCNWYKRSDRVGPLVTPIELVVYVERAMEIELATVPGSVAGSAIAAHAGRVVEARLGGRTAASAAVLQEGALLLRLRLPAGHSLIGLSARGENVPLGGLTVRSREPASRR